MALRGAVRGRIAVMTEDASVEAIIGQPTIASVLDALCFDANGLVPAIAQQHDTGEVLMMAWMNRDAVAETLATGRVCYWSRSRRRLWRKGETSGQIQHLKEFRVDCDGDTHVAAGGSGGRGLSYRPPRLLLSRGARRRTGGDRQRRRSRPRRFTGPVIPMAEVTPVTVFTGSGSAGTDAALVAMFGQPGLGDAAILWGRADAPGFAEANVLRIDSERGKVALGCACCAMSGGVARGLRTCCRVPGTTRSGGSSWCLEPRLTSPRFWGR